MLNAKFKFVDHVDRYPPAIGRDQITDHFPWLSKQAMANFDQAGNGPEGSFKVGRRRIYPTLQLLQWLDYRVSQSESDHTQPRGIVAKKQQEKLSRRGRKTKRQQVVERRGQSKCCP